MSLPTTSICLPNAKPRRLTAYNRLLLLVAGLGGLLYGIDVGIIAGALPYLEATSGLNQGQLSIVVAAVLLGSVISTAFAGTLADLLGRRWLMAGSGLLFTLSIPLIAAAQNYESLVTGRLLQGISAGLIGVVVPLYLAECLTASSRGKGTAMFQWLLTLGIVAAALIGLYFSFRLERIERIGDAAQVFAFKDAAWRRIFWFSLPPGVLFVLGSLFVSESPRWLYRHGRIDAARAALARSRSAPEVETEIQEMAAVAAVRPAKRSGVTETLWQRKYIVPFLLACVVLACNQATGVNSIIGYNTTILLQSGLSDLNAHLGYAALTIVNFLGTIVAVVLVDRKGRRFLLVLGTAGIVVSLVVAGILFRGQESRRVECRSVLQSRVAPDQTLSISFDQAAADALLRSSAAPRKSRPESLVVIYSYGDFRAATKVMRSNDATAEPLTLARATCVPSNRVLAFFSNPFADFQRAQTAPLVIENALVTPLPSQRHGWAITACILAFMAFFAIGPGVCVWLALSELMPTRIRSNGMSIALLLNQGVSTGIAAVFLPMVGKYGYGTMLFIFAGCTIVYFATAAFFLPETKGKTLEEIEDHFAKRR